jgi:multiple sugar transport system ATP-binding protein
MAEVRLDNVSKVFPGNVQAVDDFTLTIIDKEFIVLVGPSGCGKSTTLRMIAGLEEVTSGDIRIGDRIVNDVPPKDRDIAMVFQNYALYPHMTVYKNMAFGLKLRKYPKAEIENRVNEAARILGIDKLLERRPKALSGGQRQRVAVGRAIVRQPEAFLFDEPLSNLDAKLRVETRAELKKLHRRLQTTTIYVTHDQEEAMTLGDRVVVMKDGLIQQCEPPLNVYDRPVNRFVAGFVGTPPMNFFDGKIAAENGHVYFDEGSGKIRMPSEWRDHLDAYIDRPMVLGVRPESFHPEQLGKFAGEENFLNVTVSVVEPLGSEMDVYMSTPSHDEIVSRIDAHLEVEEGQELPMYINMNRVHLFEPGEAGRNVSLSEREAVAGAV